MNAYLNYIIEATIGLLAFLVFYKLLLNRETNFALLRLILLAGVFASLLLPLIHIDNHKGAAPLSISRVIPSYWLPEVVIGGENTAPQHEAPFNFWKYTMVVYGIGFMFVSFILISRLRHLFSVINRSETYRLNKLRIAESTEDNPTFSFFNFIFIGRADRLSGNEKQQIIRHESVHAFQWHSFDILLMNAMKVVFWFNPFITTYKKIFIQLHEFEADARAVENSDVNEYCSLLARAALQSADFNLASHFNYSLTVKRIEMMRTIKSNIKQWKLAAMIATLPLLFFFVACQDQVGSEISEIARNSTHALIVPDFIRERFEQVKKENPEKNYALLELNQTGSEKLNALRMQYGLPNSVEVFRTIDGKLAAETPLQAHAETIDGKLVFEIPSPNESDALQSSAIEVRGTQARRKGEQTFAIIEFNEQTSKVAEAAQQDKIYTVVEEQPEFPGGYDSMMVFLRKNIRYPVDARQQGIEGTVYVSFVVGKDGTISDTHVIRGISFSADNEAVRVVTLSPPWSPGKQNKEAVSVRFVLPIKFKLSNQTEP